MDQYIVSARKYRPTTFDDVVGQESLAATLKNSIATGRLAHAYLFCGSRGVGKTSCARIFAKTINCLTPGKNGEACNCCDSCRQFNEGRSMNIVELDAASNNGVDDIRALIEQVMTPPAIGRYRVFIIDEVHMLTSQAFNAFLKTLEEPPAHAIFILATTEKHKIIPTILSRCQIYDFNRISVEDMVRHMQKVAASEGMEAEPEALTVIARKADGAMRDALSIFDQVAACGGGKITYATTLESLNVLDSDYYNRLLDAFVAHDIVQALLIYRDIRNRGFDSQFFINGLAAYLRDLAVAQNPATLSLIEATDSERQALAERAAKLHPSFLYHAMDLCNNADFNFRQAGNKQFLVELTLIKLCQPAGPSSSNSGADEGQLMPLENYTTAYAPQINIEAAAHASKTETVAQSPAAEPVVAPQRRQARRHTYVLENLQNEVAEARASLAKEPEQPVAGQRNNEFSEADVERAWHAVRSLFESDKAMLSLMSHIIPHRNGNILTLRVTSRLVEDMVEKHIPKITRIIRDNLANDLVTIQCEISDADLAPELWTDDKVFQTICQNYPALEHLINKFNLRRM